MLCALVGALATAAAAAGAAAVSISPDTSTTPTPAIVVNATASAHAAPARSMSEVQRRAWARAFNALRSGGTLSVVQLGGSMARGQGCTDDDSAQASCAYSSRLVSWMRQAFPKATVLYENRATGGLTTGGALLSLPTLAQPVRAEDTSEEATSDGGSADERQGRQSPRAVGRARASVLLLDFAINDAFEHQVANSHLDLETYRNAKRALKKFNTSALAVYHQVAAATEAALRYLLSRHPSAPALLLVEGSCWRSARNTVDAHATVARHYGVPFVDFAATLRQPIRPVSPVYLSSVLRGAMPRTDAERHALCDACIRAKRGCEQSTTPVIFSDGKHPDHRGHAYVASALVSLMQSWAADPLLTTPSTDGAPTANGGLRASPRPQLPPPYSAEALLAQHTVCHQPTSVFSAASAWRQEQRRAGGGGGVGTNVSLVRGD